jgi:hypothetical protein
MEKLPFPSQTVLVRELRKMTKNIQPNSRSKTTTYRARPTGTNSDGVAEMMLLAPEVK